LQVIVRDNNVDQALRVLKKKMQREGVFREMKRRRFYEKPSERLAREKGDAIRRARKLARKKAQREGLFPASPEKRPFANKQFSRQPAQNVSTQRKLANGSEHESAIPTGTNGPTSSRSSQ
jgi:small subunit ribosomal protein S21